MGLLYRTTVQHPPSPLFSEPSPISHAQGVFVVATENTTEPSEGTKRRMTTSH